MVMGRPTKYREGMPQRVLEYLDKKEYDTIPSVEEVAGLLGITKETVYQWIDKYPNFSDSIKKVLDVQERLLERGGLTQKFNPTMSIFLLKVNHGKIEKSSVDVTSGGKPLPAPILGGDSAVLPNNRNKKDTESKKEN